jgi:hypothetical protein
MANKKATQEIKVQDVCFKQDLPIFLNYRNKITHKEFELTIRGYFLHIKNNATGKTALVPIDNIAFVEEFEEPDFDDE